MPPEPAAAAGLVDTHCHLDQEPLRGSLDAVLSRARGAGIRVCLTMGTTVETSRLAVACAQRHPMVRAAVGVHPHDAEAVTDEVLAAIARLAGEPGVVAIGEVGLDFFRNRVPPEAQSRALLGCCAIAKRSNLPMAFHCREAYGPLLELLAEHAPRPVRGVLHCASGPPEFIREALKLGLHVSFAGNVTFPNAGALQSLIPLVPDERLLIETDAPFLSPQPVRGTPNEPAYLVHTAEHLARARGITLEALGALVCRNARALFRIP